MLKPLGMITQPNKLGIIPPGAFSLAENAFMRDSGTVEAALHWAISQGQSATSPVAGFLVSASDSQSVMFYTNSGVWSYIWTNDVAGSTAFGPLTLQDEVPISYSIDAAARWQSVQVRSRTVLTCIRGVLVWDKAAPTTTAEATARMAGMLPVSLITTTPFDNPTTDGGGALTKSTQCNCVAIIRRKYSDGYELVSAPSSVSHAYASTTLDAAYILFQVSLTRYAKAGDVVEVYRTKAQPYAYVAPSNVFQTATNVGADYYLSTTYTVTSSDVSGQQTATFEDHTPDGNLGEALYTNQGAKGSSAGSIPPPSAKCVAFFRGYTFYGNRINPATLSFRVPTYWGGVATSGGSGAPSQEIRRTLVGRRNFLGQISSGSNTITTISAGDIVGLVVGQDIIDSTIFGAIFPFARITSVLASSVVVSVNAVSSSGAAYTFGANDTVEVDGNHVVSNSVEQLAQAVNRLSNVSMFTGELVFPATYNPSNGQLVPAGNVQITRLYTTSASTTLTIRATNGNNYVPKLPRIETNDTALSITNDPVLNGISWSEENQPENCPSLNTAFVGKGEIYAMYANRDALWIFASDGLWRLSGTGGSAGKGFNWRIDPVDSTLLISGPQAGCVLRDTIYAYTNRGLVSIDSSGMVKELSGGRLNDLLPGPNWSAPTYTDPTAMFVTADITNDEIWLREPHDSQGRTWVYNTRTDAWTLSQPIPGGGFVPSHAYYCRADNQIRFVYPLGSQYQIVKQGSLTDPMTLLFQPVYSSNPFFLRHWQVVNVAAESSVGFSLAATANGVSMGTRTVPPGDASIYSRTGYGVPRNAPCVSNNLQLGLNMTSSSLASRVRIQGVELNYVDLTEQRKAR